MAQGAASLPFYTDTAALGATAPPAAGDGPAKRAAAVFIDEFLPPNKILFIQNLPDTTTKDDLEVLFKVHPNLHDIRTIPGRKGIAFVEYMDERSAITAKEALHNYKLEEDREMKVRLCASALSHLNSSTC